MNKIKKFAAVAVLALGSVGTAQAITMDTLIGSSASANSSQASELATLLSLPGTTGATSLTRIDGTAGATFVDNLWTINLGNVANTPEYFALKLGNGGTGVANDTYFFKNIGESNILAWSNSQVNNLTGGLNNTNIGRLSHVSFFDVTFQGGGDNGNPGGGGNGNPGGGSNAVPEPGTIALLGLGLLGFAVTRRKKA